MYTSLQIGPTTPLYVKAAEQEWHCVKAVIPHIEYVDFPKMRAACSGAYFNQEKHYPLPCLLTYTISEHGSRMFPVSSAEYYESGGILSDRVTMLQTVLPYRTDYIHCS